MANRFTDNKIWNDDWFYELPAEYKLFWFFIKDDCDHAGIWNPKTRTFKALTDIDIDIQRALAYFNNGKQRVRVLDNGHWLIEDFWFFQYVKSSGKLSIKNRVHASILNIYIKENVPPSTIRGINIIVDETNESHAVGDYERLLGF